MPFHKERYPDNWKAISKKVRERSGQRCEFCGARNHQPHPETGSMVVLTVAHLDHDSSNNHHTNLAALCQCCHLRLDARQHARNAAATRLKRQVDAGQLTLDGKVFQTHAVGLAGDETAVMLVGICPQCHGRKWFGSAPCDTCNAVGVVGAKIVGIGHDVCNPDEDRVE